MIIIIVMIYIITIIIVIIYIYINKEAPVVVWSTQISRQTDNGENKAMASSYEPAVGVMSMTPELRPQTPMP